jgi:hypothetical protein
MKKMRDSVGESIVNFDFDFFQILLVGLWFALDALSTPK